MKPHRLGILSGVVASVCCLGPPLLILLGLGSLGLGSFFGKYHWYFILAGALLLAIAWRSYFKEKKRCTTAGCQMVRQGTTRSILLLATLIVALFIGLNLYTYARGQGGATLMTQTGEKQVVIPVEGMTCFTCELTVQNALGKLKGVKSSKASAKEGNVSVVYEPGLVTVREIAQAINKTGYEAQEESK